MKIHVQIACLCLLVGLIVMPLPSRAVESGPETLTPYFFVEGGEPDLDSFPFKKYRCES